MARGGRWQAGLAVGREPEAGCPRSALPLTPHSPAQVRLRPGSPLGCCEVLRFGPAAGLLVQNFLAVWMSTVLQPLPAPLTPHTTWAGSPHLDRPLAGV